MPAKGGCGASTIAGNLAYQLKRLGDKRILLADLDPAHRNAIVPVEDQIQLQLHRRDRARASNRRRSLESRDQPAQWRGRSASARILAEGMGELKDATGLVEYARDIYDLVVLDAAGVYGEWNLTQAQIADEILLVTTNELTSLQAVQRALTYMEGNGIGRFKVRLIVNRYDRHMGLSRDVIGTALHSEIYHLIPADYEAIQKALIDGKPLAPTTNFGKGVAGLVDRLAGSSEAPRKSGSLSGLMSLFSRTSS